MAQQPQQLAQALHGLRHVDWFPPAATALAESLLQAQTIRCELQARREKVPLSEAREALVKARTRPPPATLEETMKEAAAHRENCASVDAHLKVFEEVLAQARASLSTVRETCMRPFVMSRQPHALGSQLRALCRTAEKRLDELREDLGALEYEKRTIEKAYYERPSALPAELQDPRGELSKAVLAQLCRTLPRRRTAMPNGEHRPEAEQGKAQAGPPKLPPPQVQPAPEEDGGKGTLTSSRDKSGDESEDAGLMPALSPQCVQEPLLQHEQHPLFALDPASGAPSPVVLVPRGMRVATVDSQLTPVGKPRSASPNRWVPGGIHIKNANAMALGKAANTGVKSKPDQTPGGSMTPKRPRPGGDPSAAVKASLGSCACRKSRCLKMYCECFSSGRECKPSCECSECRNRGSSKDRLSAVQFYMARKQRSRLPREGQSAARVKRPRSESGPPAAGSELAADPAKICRCMRSRCLKRYCFCFSQGLYCNELCQCSDCKNWDVRYGKPAGAGQPLPRAERAQGGEEGLKRDELDPAVVPDPAAVRRSPEQGRAIAEALGVGP